MHFSTTLSAALALGGLASSFSTAQAAPSSAFAPAVAKRNMGNGGKVYEPRVMLISMFAPEDVWTTGLNLTDSFPLPGASPLYPNVTCNPCGEICHITTGEGEINAASTITSLVFSSMFDFRKTYFIVGGIAGVTPYSGTLGSAFWNRFTVQVANAYEVDARQMPSNWSTGYFLYGTTEPGLPATQFYGTEVFEFNTNLMNRALDLSRNVTLNDTDGAAAFRARYPFAPANEPPKVDQGDGATSDNYYFGSLLSANANMTVSLFTNGTGKYAVTAQEDSATAEAILRATLAGRADYTRLLVLRTASDFDQQPPGLTAYESFEFAQNGFDAAIANIFLAANPVVQDIVNNWDSVYCSGIAPQANLAETADDLHTFANANVDLGAWAKKRAIERSIAARKRSMGGQ